MKLISLVLWSKCCGYLLIVMFLCFHSSTAIAQKKSPNIIIFLSDDHGVSDAASYGNPDLKTPVLSRFAKEGMQFSNAFTPVSVCAPSRSAMMTGLYPHKNGCHQNHGAINDGVKTLPAYLKPYGYRVALAGKRHIKPESAFDFEYLEMHEIPEFYENVEDKPFCLIIAFSTPHQPYFNLKNGYTKVQPKEWLPSTPETQQLIEAYYDHVALLDQEMGTQLYWVEKYGLEDAFQVYTSDHGPAFPFAKWTLYNQGIQVPFMVKWNGHVEAGAIQNNMISLVDLLPTIMAVSGDQEVQKQLDGKNLLPLITGKSNESIHDYIYAAYTNIGVNGANQYPVRAIQDESFKLIVNLNHENEFQVARMDEPDSRALIDSYQVIQAWLKEESANPLTYERALNFVKRPKLEFYNLDLDPYELNNLGNDPAHQQVIDKMIKELKGWMKDQQDPMLDGLKKLL